MTGRRTGTAAAGPWSGLRVVEVGGEVRGGTGGMSSAYATRMWAALGAEVIVAEPHDGHLLRHLPPFAPGTDESLWWAYFGQGKRSVVAPPGSAAAGRAARHRPTW